MVTQSHIKNHCLFINIHCLKIANSIALLFYWFSIFPCLSIADNTDRRAIMAESILSMMDAMGWFWNQALTKSAPQQNWNHQSIPLNVAPWNAWNNWNSSMPWPNSIQNNFLNSQPPNMNNELDGNWISNSGELLQIKGDNFYLQATDGRKIWGILQIHARMLMLQQPRLRLNMLYEYAIQNNRLALRDVQGNLLLYQRVR